MKILHSEREKHRYYNSLSEDQKYDAFSEILFDSENVVFLGGAGVSTESGIPDYRKNMDARTAEPNAAHRKLAEMEASGRLQDVITQNIDGLHQKAGSRNVQEIHGTIWKNHCVSCGAEYGVNFIFDSSNPVPRCPVCGRTVRPDVTLYGEFTNAINLIGRADCLIVGGTSLEVGSAAQLVHMFHVRHLVIINKGKTKMEGAADLVFHDSIGKVLHRI